MDQDFDRLTTDRLVIRRFVPSDADALTAYRSDPEIARYQSLTPPYPRERAVGFIEWLGEHHPDEPGEWYQLAVATRERPDELIGDLAFSPDADDPATARIGFTLRREAQGHGYATEAVRAPPPGWLELRVSGYGRGERHCPATTDLPITMRVAEAPEPCAWPPSA